jgi:hypothetical protein
MSDNMRLISKAYYWQGAAGQMSGRKYEQVTQGRKNVST